MRSNHLLVAAAFASAVALAGCDKSRPLPAPSDPARGCTTCHGGQDNQTGAPPFSLPRNGAGDIVASGNRFTSANTLTAIEVGAHTRHIARGVACGSCHVVPASIMAPNHNTGRRATVIFGGVAAAGNAIVSAWSPVAHTCSNYCHGSSINHGGTNHTPNWLGGTPAGACGTCHFASGVTPPAAHPKGLGASGAFADTKECAACHTETVDPLTGDINVTGGKHVNGQLDGGGGHTAGWVDPTKHGPAASGNLGGCKVCHGNDFGGGSSGVSCTACHTTAGHPNWQTECTFCHGSAARTADTTFPSVGTGTVVRANLASPPLGSQGENTITAYAVGAHDAHVGGGAFARPAQCSECHGPTLPTSLVHVGGTVLVGWGVTASNGITPAPAAGNLVRWNDTSGVVPNCTNFCHGATLAGGSHTSVKWNEGATGATCGSCHAIPLPYTAGGKWHVPRQDCNACHTGYTNSSVNLADHIFVGAKPSALTCTSCHGTSTTNAAPPNDITGATTGGNAIGAHQKHVASITFHQGNFACTECHPDNTGNNGHANGLVNIAWGPTASANLTYAVAPAAGTFTTGAAFPTCTTYCHNPRKTDTASTNPAPSWTGLASTVTCGSCHGLPPVGTGHSTSTACGTCHDGYANAPSAASPAASVSLANHINGVVNVANLACTSCHGTAGRTLAGADPLLAAAPPVAYTGINAVGAHLAHVFQGDTAAPGFLSKPLLCANCHTGMLYTSAPHTYPVSPVAFGNLAVAASAAPAAYDQATQTCASTYCHGQFAGGKPGNSISWNSAGKLACNACHGQATAAAPQPTYPHPQNTACANCHGAGYAVGAVAAATHVDGLTTGITAGCTACHGDRSNTAVTLTASTASAAPGVGNAATSADTTGALTGGAVGAHLAHLVGAGGTPRWRSTPIACTECHGLPLTNGDTSHATGGGTGGARATLAFGNVAQSTAFETKTATYTSPTCSSTYCHDPKSTDTQTSVPQVNAPSWIGATTQAQCGSCHGLPPLTASHPANALCGSCHPGYTATAPTSASTITAVNAATHLNGQLEGGGESTGGSACTGCHSGTVALMTGAASKHSLVGWTDTATDSGGAWGAAATLSSVLPAQRSCVNMCHSDHPHTLTTPATTTHQYNLVADPSSATSRSAGSATSTTRVATDFDTATNTGMCTKCHAKPITAGGPVITDVVFGASAHDFTSTTTPAVTWSYALHDGSLFLRNCTKCHASSAEGTTPASSGSGLTAVHGQANPDLLAGTKNPGASPATFICYNCHGSATIGANLSNKDVATRVAAAFNHPASASNTHDTTLEAAATFASGRFSGANRHANCIDCHGPHAAGPTKVVRTATATATRNQIPAGSPLLGATGITYGPTYPTLVTTACGTGVDVPTACVMQTTAANYGASPVAATLEYQVCFKCHTSYAFGATYPTAPATGASGMKQTDLGSEFSPTNRSGHPVVVGLNSYTGSTAPKALVASQLLTPWNVNVGTQTMLCTDCHNTDAAAPAVQGPHGSAVRFMLAGANKAWPYTVAGATTGTLFKLTTSETGIGTTNGLFCRNCHPVMNSAASNAIHRDGDLVGGQHGGNATVPSCTGCHIRVPHGGKVSRLIVTTNAPARYKLGTVNMAGFTKGTKDAYTVDTNFKSSCGEHSGFTSAEAW